jgi:hypothetical protein
MSYASGFGLNGKSLYTNVTKPMEVWCNFVVDSANGNGFGVRSLKSNGYIESVYMATSATPGKIAGYTNPNPQAGYALVRFKNNFNYYLGGFSGQVVPLTSPTTTSLTAGHAYIITVLGTTTLAQWQAVGIPLGFTPAVGMSFVATATASISGTGKVGIPGVPTTQAVTVVGDPNASIANSNIAAYAGAVVMVQFSAPTAAGTTTLIPAAPADGTVVAMQFCFDGSTVTIDGL